MGKNTVIIDCTCYYCISAISWLCGYDSWVKQSRPHGWRQNGITVWFVLIILRIGRVVISVVEYQTIFAIPTRKNGSDIVPMAHLRVIMGSLKGQIVLPVVSSKTTLLKISKISQFISPVLYCSKFNQLVCTNQWIEFDKLARFTPKRLILLLANRQNGWIKKKKKNLESWSTMG